MLRRGATDRHMILARAGQPSQPSGAADGGLNCYTAITPNHGNASITGDLTMTDTKFFDDLSAKLSELVKNSPARDIEKNARALLMQGFAKLDLVTRDEFDIQAEMLARARQQLTALEARVAALEAQRHPAAQ